MVFLQTVLAFLLALGVLVTVHELGHYWVARACGVRVLRFSIGFGRVLWRWQRQPSETEWVLAAFPFGGYVKMLDEREAALEGKEISAADAAQAFNRQPVWRRMLIVAAGPVANLVLAIALYTVLFSGGTQEPAAILAIPPTQSVAAKAGLTGGEKILAIQIDGKDQAVHSWIDLRWQLIHHTDEEGLPPLLIETSSGRRERIKLPATPGWLADPEQDSLKNLGLELQAGPVMVREILANSPAKYAGLQVGDVIESVDGVSIGHAVELIEKIKNRPGGTLLIKIRRDGVQQQLSVTLDIVHDDAVADRPIGKLGVAFTQKIDMQTVQYSLPQSLVLASSKVWETSIFSLQMIGRMVIGQASLKNISGPLTIADYAGKTARLGWDAFIGFLALISISLAVLNLLPIPMLDGGHLLYYCVEFLTGKPVSDSWQATFQKVGIVSMLLLTSLAIFNDLTRILRF